MQVKDKRVVVTGAASGIGKALSVAFHKAGAQSVVAVDMNIEGADGNIGIGGFRKTNRKLFVRGEVEIEGQPIDPSIAEQQQQKLAQLRSERDNERATSPFANEVSMFEVTPPGAAAIIITPIASSGEIDQILINYS